MHLVLLAMSWPEAISEAVGYLAFAAVSIAFFWALSR
jgi:hypothetical protein